MKPLPTSLLAAALSLSIAGAAFAADDKAAPAAGNRELATARAELDRAAKRYAELAREHGALARDAQARVLQSRSRPVLGVLLAADEEAGVRITGVTPGSGAAKAGLKSGDRLVSVDGTDVLGSNGALRVENARKLLRDLKTDTPVRIGYVRDGRRANATATPAPNARAFAFTTGDGGAFEWFDGAELRRIEALAREFADSEVVKSLPGIAPEVRREVIRLADGEAPRLLSAFRWNGLNLAALDPQLGRYFGADAGVLVLSNGELEGLQAGDVIRRVDGKAVGTPREVMAVLRDKDDGERVAVDYLRDRKPAQARVAIPKAMAWPPAPPPAPPAPPAPPSPATPKAAPPAPSAPPAPPAPPRVAAFFGNDGEGIAFIEIGATQDDAAQAPAPAAR